MIVLKLPLKGTPELTKLSTIMEVTVDGMDAVVEPSGMSSWRVTEMTVLNLLLRTEFEI